MHLTKEPSRACYSLKRKKYMWQIIWIWYKYFRSSFEALRNNFISFVGRIFKKWCEKKKWLEKILWSSEKKCGSEEEGKARMLCSWCEMGKNTSPSLTSPVCSTGSIKQNHSEKAFYQGESCLFGARGRWLPSCSPRLVDLGCLQ